MTEKYNVKKEENEDERRSRPRRSPTAEDADGDAGGGGKTSATPSGAQSPAKAEPDEAMRTEADEIIERFMDDLRQLRERGRHPYVQVRTRNSLIAVEVGAAKTPDLAKPMFGDHMYTLLKGSRFTSDELGHYIGSLMALDNQKLFTIFHCQGCLLKVVEVLERLMRRRTPR